MVSESLVHVSRGSLRRRAWPLLTSTLGGCVRNRVTGLAAEAAFFTILSLPPLIFGVAGTVGYVTSSLNVATIANLRGQILRLASRVLTADAVDTVLAPTLNDVLSAGHFSVISVGFVLALWSGSRALNVFVDTITIMYGMAGRRGLVKTRLLSFGLYLIFLLTAVVLLPLVLAGPGFVSHVLPARLDVVGLLYWPVVLVGSGLFLVALYHFSVPVRSRLRSDIPGAALSLSIWVGGSALLRLVLDASAGSTTVYGPLAAPIAVLIWLYVISLAVLVGAAFNAAADELFPRLSGIDPLLRRDPSRRPEQAAATAERSPSRLPRLPSRMLDRILKK